MSDDKLATEVKTKRQYQEVDGITYCDRRGCPGSTGLRCYRTGVPICVKCSIRTPVGYLSKDAAREQQDQFFNAESTDYIIAAVVAFFSNLVIGLFAVLIGGVVWSFLGFFSFIFLLPIGAGAAGMISEMVWWALRKRRGRYTGQVVVGAIVISSLPLLILGNIIVLLIYVGVVSTTVSARFQMGLRV